MSSREQKMRRFTGNVPEEMVTNILLRLDPKTLVGFKSVSKTWLALISSPHFAKSLLEITEKEEEVHIVHTDDNAPVSLINLGTRQVLTTLKFPINKCSFRLVGSACGIVCFSILSDQGINENCLWNLATNFYKLVPFLPVIHDSAPVIDDSEAHFIADYGFGFDEIDNDFKIIRVMWRSHDPDEYEYSSPSCDKVHVNLYSSKRNVWRKVEQEGKTIDDIGYNLCNFDVSVSGGLLCCVGCYGIITFDLHTEVLNCPAIIYPVPTFKAKINNYDELDANACITNLNDSIAVIIYKQIGYSHGSPKPLFNHKEYKLNLWALNDKTSLHGGGIQASRTLIYDIDVNLPLNRVHGYLNIDDLLLLLYDEDWCLYNLERKKAQIFHQ